MYHFLKGKVDEVGKDFVILNVNNVGYFIFLATMKKLNTKKVGHTGTLDPNATGVLPILIGKGTKISKYLMEHDKTYIATLKLGEKTDTGDSEGQVIEEKSIPKDLRY